MTDDRRLGAALRLRQPKGNASRQQLGAMVRDLVGADQSLLAPLQHLIGNSFFLALDPANASRAERLCTRDQLLADMAETYQPKVVERLRAFLNGYLDLPDTGAVPHDPVIWGDDPPVPSSDRSDRGAPPAQSTSATTAAPYPQPVTPAPTTPASTAGCPAGSGPHPIADAAASSAPAPSATAGPSQGADAPPSPRRIPLVLGLSLLAGLGVGLAYRLHALCRPLGLCPVPTSNTSQPSLSAKALDRAQQAADSMEQARSLPSYETALSDLDKELLWLSGDPLTPAQVAQMARLQRVARDGSQRLMQEKKEAAAVAEAKGRIDSLPKLPTERQAPEREAIRAALSTIPSRSFSYGDAQAQLIRLNALAAPPEAPSETPAEEGAQAPEPGPTPAPISPAPTPRRDWSSGERSWSPPRRESPSAPPSRPAPAPAPPEDSGSNAPHRDDPLF